MDVWIAVRDYQYEGQDHIGVWATKEDAYLWLQKKCEEDQEWFKHCQVILSQATVGTPEADDLAWFQYEVEKIVMGTESKYVLRESNSSAQMTALRKRLGYE